MQAALTWVRSHSESLGLAAGLFREPRAAPARARRGHPQGRPVGRRHHGDGSGVAADRTARAAEPGHDRRDHPHRAVLPVGGIKEKVLAAKRAGITEILLPRENAVHVEEDLKKEQLEGVALRYVRNMEQVIGFALEPEPGETGFAAESANSEPVLVP